MRRRATRWAGTRRHRRAVRLLAALIAVVSLGWGAEEAGARCVRVGVDSISHTQCGLP